MTGAVHGIYDCGNVVEEARVGNLRNIVLTVTVRFLGRVGKRSFLFFYSCFVSCEVGVGVDDDRFYC